MIRFLPAVWVVMVCAFPVQAQVRSYYYGQPPSTRPLAGENSRDVVYGSGQGSPVSFGTPGTVYYAPGYATSYYQVPAATFSPPGFFDPRTFATPTYAVPAALTYTPGYYSYSYTTPPSTSDSVRPLYSAPRVYYGVGQTYR